VVDEVAEEDELAAAAVFRARVQQEEEGFPLRDSPRQLLGGQQIGRLVAVVDSSRDAPHLRDSGGQAPRIKLSASRPA
jgi:hypothetical protein